MRRLLYPAGGELYCGEAAPGEAVESGGGEGSIRLSKHMRQNLQENKNYCHAFWAVRCHKNIEHAESQKKLILRNGITRS